MNNLKGDCKPNTPFSRKTPMLKNLAIAAFFASFTIMVSMSYFAYTIMEYDAEIMSFYFPPEAEQYSSQEYYEPIDAFGFDDQEI